MFSGSWERAGVDGCLGWSSGRGGLRSGEFWERAYAGERAGEVVLPWPAGRKVKRPLASRAGQPAGDLKQPAAHGARDAHSLARQPDHVGPAQQVVRDRGDHCPGAVRVELAGGEMRERLVFEVADRELDDGVLAVLSLHDLQRLGAVGDEREIPPVRPQLCLWADEPGAAHDQPPAVSGYFGDLRFTVIGVVLQGLPRLLGDLLDRLGNPELQAHADRVAPAGALERRDQLAVPESRVGPEKLLAGGACPRHAGDQLLGETHDTALGVCLALAQPNVQNLAGTRPTREQRMVATLFGVPETDTLLLLAIGLADKAVHVNDQPLSARPAPRPPRAHQRLVEYPVELAHMPESESPKKRPQRRGRRQPATQQSTRATSPQNITIIDAVGAEQHREHERHHLPARIRSTRPITTKRHEPAHQLLDPESPRERRNERDPRVRNHPLIVKNDPHPVQSDRRVILHHTSDLLIPGRDSRNLSLPSPIQEVILCSPPDNTGGSRLRRAARQVWRSREGAHPRR